MTRRCTTSHHVAGTSCTDAKSPPRLWPCPLRRSLDLLDLIGELAHEPRRVRVFRASSAIVRKRADREDSGRHSHGRCRSLRPYRSGAPPSSTVTCPHVISRAARRGRLETDHYREQVLARRQIGHSRVSPSRIAIRGPRRWRPGTAGAERRHSRGDDGQRLLDRGCAKRARLHGTIEMRPTVTVGEGDHGRRETGRPPV